MQTLLLGDGIYAGDDRVITPWRFADLVSDNLLSAHMKRAYNRTLRRERVLVEWVIGRVVTRFKVLHKSCTWTLAPSRMSDVMRAACLLSNFLFRTRGEWPAADPDYDPDAMPIHPEDYVE
jgi:hypothetical protein